MLFDQRKPCNALRSIVKQFYLLRMPNDLPSSALANHPQGCFDFAFLLNGQMDIITSQLHSTRYPYTFLGLLNTHFELRVSPGTRIAGITFYPEAFSFFDRLVNKEYSTIQFQDSEYPIHFEDTWKRLQDAQSNEQRYALLERLVFHHLNNQSQVNRSMIKMISKIRQQNGIINFSRLADDAGMSSRTLQRKFLHSLGVTPKSYSQTIRFHSILKYLDDNPHADWSKIAMLFNYADQPHLIKDFKRFTGCSPKLFFQSNRRLSEFFRGIEN